MDLKGMGCEDWRWVEVSQDLDQQLTQVIRGAAPTMTESVHTRSS